jgi:hypothetical protein
VTSSGHQNYQLVLANRGPARAEDVAFELVEPTEGFAPSLILQGHSFPIALDAEQEYTIVASVVMGTAPAVDIALRWTDGAGAEEKTLTLAVFGR